jgi:hypothetical protein
MNICTKTAIVSYLFMPAYCGGLPHSLDDQHFLKQTSFYDLPEAEIRRMAHCH